MFRSKPVAPAAGPTVASAPPPYTPVASPVVVSSTSSASANQPMVPIHKQAAAAAPIVISKAANLAGQAASQASQLTQRVVASLPADLKDKIPSIDEVRNMHPGKAVYNAAMPYLKNEDGRLGEDTPEARSRTLQRVQWLSQWLDAKFYVPGTNYKIGLDPIISAVPMVGDAISTLLSIYVVYLTRRFHVPWWVTARMVWNVLLNAGFGTIPVLGSAFDVAYKPNMRNLNLLENWLRKEALAAGKSTKHIDAAIAKSRAEIIQAEDVPGLSHLTGSSSTSDRVAHEAQNISRLGNRY
ncbi:hypothetical protein HKX48_002728 [Thoreauomyces humboldtii]|nr:hypothetical protein HKX48_002728 [Thoreauomyces humboldtii]